MKNTISGLGKLGTQLFALMQMRGQEILHFGELQSALHLSLKQEKNLLSSLSKRGYILRLQKGLYLIPRKIPPGGNWQPSAYYLISQFMCDSRASYYIGGMDAFHHYGLTEQVPNITTVYNTKISGCRRMGKLIINMIKVPQKKIGLSKSIKLTEGVDVNIATLPKTIVDAFVDWRRYNTLPIAFEWIKNYLNDNMFLKDFVNAVVLYGNISAKRRIGYYLDKLTHNEKLITPILTTLKPTQSWIALNPRQENKGITNKKWGIIDNAEGSS